MREKTAVGKIQIDVPARVMNHNEVFASNEESENLDVMYLGFTLCHEGANNNGDRFTIDELKKAWKTASYKPINWEHAEPNVGVILDAALKVGGDEKASTRNPAQIDCVGAIWRTRYPEYATLISQASNDDSLRMSMEAYFTDYDFIMGDFEEIIPSSEASEEMHDLLGTFFNGKLVSRTLKNVIFGGAGITASPADEKARIWACAFEKSDNEYHEYLHDVYEGRKMSVMSKDLVIAEHEKISWKMARNLESGGN